jgi:tetratricopeptide (TPR) repeat protein
MFKKPLTLIILLAVSLFLSANLSGQNQSGDLVELTMAAFTSLDEKVTTGFSRGFQLKDDAVSIDDPLAPLFENLGDYSFPISTENEMAQKYFDQGFRLTYAFNHAEAHRSFKEAARLDDSSAMAYWGQAYALGPNINDPFPDDERKQAAFQALEMAVDRKANASQKEQDLIDALTARYGFSKDTGTPLPHGYLAGDDTELDQLNRAFADAMKELAIKYPEDPDILTLYGASVMDFMPWNYWDQDGNPNPGIGDAKMALEKAMELNPKHPGAHHYYIHMVELPNPDLAVPSAEILGDLMPAAGHMVHMPSHIFIRVGRYKDAAMANVDAIKADEDYISQCLSQGIYPLGYYPHNIHFLWSSSSLLGNSETALAAARKTAEKVPIGQMEALPFLQDFYSTPMLAYVRFGKWNEILTIPNPAPSKHVSMIWHYARGMAFIRKGNLPEAEEELIALEMFMNNAELDELIANITNPSSELAKIAYHVVAGELEAAKGNFEAAIGHLEQGVLVEDALVYSEPSPWHIPVRQSLGAVLLDADRPAEAEMVYRADLEINRNNGWSLQGLHQSLLAQDKSDEAKVIKAQFDDAWKDADVELTASRF